jgi:hypothetical protein
LSANVGDFTRNVYAFIGADPTVDPQQTPTSTSTLGLGATTMTSTIDGTIVAAAIAGTFSNLGQPNPNANVNNPIQGVNLPNGQAPNVASSTGLAGSGGALIFNDKALAYLNASGNATVASLQLTATNNQSIYNADGGVAIALNSAGAQTSGQYSGAFAINVDTTDTEAFIKGIKLASSGAVKVTAAHSGVLDSFTAALSFNRSQTGKAFAGSVSINPICCSIRPRPQSAAPPWVPLHNRPAARLRSAPQTISGCSRSEAGRASPQGRSGSAPRSGTT